MQTMVTERLKRKYAEKALQMIRSNRSDAAEMGFKTENWTDVASGKAEELLEMLLDLIKADIEEMEAIAAEQGVVYDDPEPVKSKRKRGKYMGVADDYTVENGDYRYEE